MTFTPLEHQRHGIDHLLANDTAALFAGMGLGKTAMVLSALNQLIADGASKGALVIAPLRVSLFTWRDEIAKWENFRWMKIVSLRTEEGRQAWANKEACIYTINYESLFIPRKCPRTGETVDHGILGKLLKGVRGSHLPVDTVIWDELSKAKNPSSKRIQHFRKYRQKFKRHWGLTGTPVPNSYLDLFAQIRLLDDGATFGKVMGNFKTQYFQPVDYMQRKWEVRDGCAGLIEEKIKPFTLTLRSEDWLDIPPTTTTDVEVALPKSVAPIYKKLEKEMLIQLQQSEVVAVNQAVLVGKLMQVVSGAVYADRIEDWLARPDEGDKSKSAHILELHDAKIKALRKLFNDEGQQPMIVAIRYKHERERILAAFPEARAFSSECLPDWNAGKIKMLVAHPASMGHGLNMQSGGCRACWFTPTYSREEYDQLNARVVRTGQTQKTKIFRLVASGTIDDAVVAANDAKGDNQSAFLATLKNLQTLAGAR